MIKNFNQSVDSMYTNKGIGMKFFKDKILRQGSELEWRKKNVNLNVMWSRKDKGLTWADYEQFFL